MAAQAPVPERPGRAGVIVRVATWNIHRAIGRDGRADHGRIAGVLRELDADVVALQEVGYWSGQQGNALQLMADAIAAEAIEGITLLDERGHYGNAVLSRLPVSLVHRHDLSLRGREPRGAIELRVQVNSRSLRLVATHLGLDPRERRYQVDRLAALFRHALADLEVLTGDLNEWFIFSRQLRQLHRVLGALPSKLTYPSARPLFALDRLWSRPREAVSALRVHASALARAASDHLPLVADLDTTRVESVVTGPEPR